MSKVTIIYKSGFRVVCVSDGTVEVTRSITDDTITKVKWGKLEPYPLHLGIGEIAAIWEGEV